MAIISRCDMLAGCPQLVLLKRGGGEAKRGKISLFTHETVLDEEKCLLEALSIVSHRSKWNRVYLLSQL
jgi:hypothetical protein